VHASGGGPGDAAAGAKAPAKRKLLTWGEYLCRGIAHLRPPRDPFINLPSDLIREIMSFLLPTAKGSLSMKLFGSLKEMVDDRSVFQGSRWMSASEPDFGKLLLAEDISTHGNRAWTWKGPQVWGVGEIKRFSLLEAAGIIASVSKNFHRELHSFPFVRSFVARLKFLSTLQCCWEVVYDKESGVWSIDLGDVFQREPWGPPPIPVEACPPEFEAMMAKMYSGFKLAENPFKANASINNNPPFFVAQVLCLPRELAFDHVTTCCFDVMLWVKILAEELTKRASLSEAVYTKTFSIGAGCRRHSSNDAHCWDMNQYAGGDYKELEAFEEAFRTVDTFLLSRAPVPDDFAMLLPLVCRNCRLVDTDHHSNYPTSRYLDRELECEKCSALISSKMAKLCFGCMDDVGVLCACMQPHGNGNDDDYDDENSFVDDRGYNVCGIACAECLPALVCKSCGIFHSKYCPNHECVEAQKRPEAWLEKLFHGYY